VHELVAAHAESHVPSLQHPSPTPQSASLLHPLLDEHT
jgi:hypothetical protein